MKIFNVFTENDIAEIKGAIKKCQWIDGKKSAVGSAKNKKQNSQIVDKDPNFKPILEKIMSAHELQEAKAYTYYDQIINPRVASYTSDDHYDWHVDITHIGNQRTDLSFTIFLSDPAEYDGGEMLIQIMGQNFKIKRPAGTMVVYPSGLNHKVNPVTRGTRLVIIGWIKSHIKREEHRERLLQMRIEMAKTEKLVGIDKMDGWYQLYQQLVRDFS